MSGNVNYQPRKCSATNKLITAKDHAAVQVCCKSLIYTYKTQHQ